MNYATIKKNDIANGPGIRVSLFVSGCRHHCKNCFNKEAWDFNFGKPFDEDVISQIIESAEFEHIEGLSLLGGEPFEPENQDGILALIVKFREKFPQKNIWCYSGFTFEELISGKVGDVELVKKILSNLDVLVDGKFLEELKDLSLIFRGSSNQRIIDVKKSLQKGEVVCLEGKWKRQIGSTNIYDL